MIDLFLFTGAGLGILLLIPLARLILGPTVADRVVALDTMNTLVIACMTCLGVAFHEIVYVDVAIVYAILAFISTLFIAKQLEVKE